MVVSKKGCFMKRVLTAVIIASFTTTSTAAVDITVDAQKDVKKISPYLYGRNIGKQNHSITVK